MAPVGADSVGEKGFRWVPPHLPTPAARPSVRPPSPGPLFAVSPPVSLFRQLSRSLLRKRSSPVDRERMATGPPGTPPASIFLSIVFAYTSDEDHGHRRFTLAARFLADPTACEANCYLLLLITPLASGNGSRCDIPIFPLLGTLLRKAKQCSVPNSCQIFAALIRKVQLHRRQRSTGILLPPARDRRCTLDLQRPTNT